MGSDRGAATGEDLNEVLASIRALVSAETASRLDDTGGVVMLTADMRIDAANSAPAGEILVQGIDAPPPRDPSAPILDEEALRDVVNQIVREELQGELGERISRNLRRLIRRELTDMLAERDRT